VRDAARVLVTLVGVLLIVVVNLVFLGRRGRKGAK
jgi:hypothetical protein